MRRSSQSSGVSHAQSASSEPAGTTASTSTRERLISEATRLFAGRGIDATSIRELAQAADVNVAAVHYHFGGKEELYQSVIERAFLPMVNFRATLSEQLERARDAGTREAAAEALRKCVHAFMSQLFAGGRPTWAGLFLQRESIEPTPAMRRCLEEFVGPVWETTLELIALLRSDLDKIELRWIASSIVAQCVYFQNDRGIVRFTFGLDEAGIDDAFVSRAAEHIARFSLSALDRQRGPE